MRSIRVLIADDQVTDREGISALLAKRSDIVIVGKAETSASVLPLTKELGPDVVLVDLLWHGNKQSGAKIIRELKAEMPHVRVIALTNYLPLIEAALKEGADEAVAKSYTRDELVSLVHGVCKRVASNQQEIPIDEDELTERESEVLKLIAAGHTDKAIGSSLGISSNTVKHHAASIYRKLQVASRAEAVMRGYKLGLIKDFVEEAD